MNAAADKSEASTNIVRNERTKLVANALDRASTACFAIGVLAPIVAATYDSASGAGSAGKVLYFASLFWLASALILHFGAQHVLGRLK